MALNEDYFKRFVPHFPIGHKSNPVNLGRSELWTLKELMSPLALVTYFTTKPYWILALKYTKTNELGTKTSHSIVYGTKVYVKEMSSYIAMIYRVSHRFGNSTYLIFWPGNVWSWKAKVAVSSSKMKKKIGLNLSVNVYYQLLIFSQTPTVLIQLSFCLHSIINKTRFDNDFLPFRHYLDKVKDHKILRIFLIFFIN